jgi:hypothetical protein
LQCAFRDFQIRMKKRNGGDQAERSQNLEHKQRGPDNAAYATCVGIASAARAPGGGAILPDRATRTLQRLAYWA